MDKMTNKKNVLGRAKPKPIDLIYGKMAPQAPDLEGAILGALMLERGAMDLVLEIIPGPECFYSDANQRIYAALIRMYRRGASIDFMTVCEELRKASELEMVGGSYYVTGLTRDVVSSAHIEEHSWIVMQKYILRDVIRFCGETLADAYENSCDAPELIDKVGEYGVALSDKVIKKQFEHISIPADKLLERTIALCQSEVKITGIKSGFKELDALTGGWQKTDLIILAARPAVGKSAFILNITMGAVLEAWQELSMVTEIPGVAIFSLEMSAEQLLQRTAANMCDIDLDKITKGLMNESEQYKFAQTLARLRQMPVYFDDTASLDTMQLKAKARRLKMKHNVGLIIIDYLQLMVGDTSRGGSNGNREQEISKISRDLKGLAKTLEIPIIALSQMSRNVESRRSNVPVLSDLRESGAIEQDADLVIFLYKESADTIKKNPMRAVDRHCSIAKHRNGKTGDLIYDFDGPKQRFHNEERTVIDISHEDMTFKQVVSDPIYTAEYNSISAPEPGGDNLANELPF